MTASLNSIIAASKDPDILERLAAAATVVGITEPQWFVDANAGRLVSVPVNETGSDTVSSVYEYAVATYVPQPRPGENPAAVTDDHLIAAVLAVKAEVEAREVQP